ncbi:MAG: hypothetical protein AB1486_10040 [Planctomycetota bacterium]
MSVALGCASVPEGPTGPLPVYVWPPGGLADPAPLRVVVLPFVDETGHPAEAARLEEAFLAALVESGRFEVIPHTASSAEFASGGTRRSGRSRVEPLLALSLRHGAGGALYGTVTQLRPYGEPLVGLHVELISTVTGDVLWSARGVLDGSVENTVRHLRLYHEREVATAPGQEDFESLRRSLTRFFTFAADVFVATL